MTDYSTSRDSLISPGNLDTLAQYAASSPPGAFVEVGVYRGGSARVLYRVAEEQQRKLFLFDTFTGHPRPSEHDDPVHPLGRFDDCADPLDLLGEMPNARVVAGPFPWSLYQYFPQLDMARVAFAHIDVDLYESTHNALAVLRQYMVPSGIMYFDDYGVPECPGATKAIDELLPDREVLSNGKALWRR